MKLIELAKEYNLEPDLLREVVEEDLSIPLPSGMDSVLKDKEVSRILACDGLETVDGKPFQPIIAKEFQEKHKRAVAAKKGAETRKRKIQEEVEAHKRVEDVRIAEERRKHEGELARREVERLAREAAEAEALRQREEIEAITKSELEAARTAADDDMRKRESEAKRLAAEFAAIRSDNREAKGEPATATAAPSDLAAAPVAAAPAAAAPPAAPAPTPAAPTPAEISAAREAAAREATAKSMKGLGSKLASLAKATHEKADHSIKAVPKLPGATSYSSSPAKDETLSPEDRKRLIQENIRKNLAMADKVKLAKIAERTRRKPGFAPIDRSKTPGGPAGPRGPGRGGPGAGRGPQVARGPKRDNKDHRSDKADAVDDTHDRVGNRRRALSTEEEDLSGKTEFEIALPCTVRELSEASGIKSSTVIAKLFMAGVMASINSVLEKDAVELLAQEFKKTVTFIEAKNVDDEVEAEHAIEDKPEDLAPRPPVVTIMGHVDHGKTSLLDAIRKTNVTAGEAGGITQHVGAYTVSTPSGLDVTFIDTPGHQAFTAMRARGAQVTDIVVIVVAADDGVMPQTIEAINHAKAAEVTIVVAMNKIDKATADPDKVLRQLAELGLQAEEWGGETAVIKVSATAGTGLEELLERLALEADVLELKANHFAPASGTVIEANRSEGQGVTATLLVQRGSLAVGDVILAGTGFGKVRAMTNWKGEQSKLAGPSHAVEVIGLSDMPRAGDRFAVLGDLKQAAEAADVRQQAQRERELAARSKVTTAASIFGDLAHAKKKEVKVIVKADAAGSLEVLNKTIPELSTDDVRATIIHSAVGGVTANDISLAEASQALVVGFHVIADSKARQLAEKTGIEILTYTIIYELLDDMKKAMAGKLDPEVVEKVIGHAEVRNTFNTSKVGMVAGLYVSDGLVRRDAFMRITREQIIIHSGKVNSLRRFKEDVKEVKEGYECGMTIEGFQDVKVGDVMEFFAKEKRVRTL